jgi:hypothetical protein
VPAGNRASTAEGHALRKLFGRRQAGLQATAPLGPAPPVAGQLPEWDRVDGLACRSRQTGMIRLAGDPSARGSRRPTVVRIPEAAGCRPSGIQTLSEFCTLAAAVSRRELKEWLAVANGMPRPPIPPCCRRPRRAG